LAIPLYDKNIPLLFIDKDFQPIVDKLGLVSVMEIEW